MKDSAPDLTTDAAWEQWGQRDPYFGVITNPKFRRAGLTAQARDEFFLSGQAHAQWLMDRIHRYIDPGFTPASVLDFGCGVGRTLIPLAMLANEAVGLDVSPSMLLEARKNCDRSGVANVRLALSDDVLSSASGSFSLIHSFIVFQHIPPARGRQILQSMLPLLAPGGVAAVHFSYSKSIYAATNGVAPPAPESVAEVTRQPAADPEIQMNPYNMNEILFLIQNQGVLRFHTEFTDHGGELGIFLFFQVA